MEPEEICYMEFINLIENVGFSGARDYLYCRLNNGPGKGKLVPIDHGSDLEQLKRIHSNDKKISLCVFREKARAVDIATIESLLDDATGSTRKKRQITITGYTFMPNLQLATPSIQTLINIFPGNYFMHSLPNPQF